MYMTRKKREIRCYSSRVVTLIPGIPYEIERFLFCRQRKLFVRYEYILSSSLEVPRSNYSRKRDIQPRFI